MTEVAEEIEEEDGFYTEARVADSLGVSRARVKAIRDERLEKGRDWLMTRNRVVLTERGLNEVMLALAPGSENGQDSALVKWTPRRAIVEVDRISRNPRIVSGKIVRVEDGPASEGPPGPKVGPVIGQAVRVRVRSNVNFIPGMEMPCYREAWDVWVLDRPCPRFRGRW